MDKLWRQRKWLKTQKWGVMIAAVATSICVATAVYLIPPQPAPYVPTAWVHGPVFKIATKRTTLPLAIPQGQYTGIEAIYLMKSGQYDINKNLEDNSALWAAKISQSGQVVEVRAMQVSENGEILDNGQIFDIVVTVRVKAPDNIAYLRKDNMRVWLSASGAFTIPDVGEDNYAPDDRECVFENSGYGTTNGYMRVNVVWDNRGEGYLLSENTDLYIDKLELELFGKTGATSIG
jgi:hypothetical protein